MNMKTKLFLCVMAFISLAFSFQAQSIDALPANEDFFVIDGTNRSFAWGRHIAPDKIAIGLSDEGVYEIRNNNSIWLVNHPKRKDRQIVDITTDEQTGRLVFKYHTSAPPAPMPPVPASGETPIEIAKEEMDDPLVVGCYNPSDQSICLKNDKNPIAVIDKDGNIISPQNRTVYISVNAKTSDKVLSAFFFLFHYYPTTQLN